MPTTLIIGGTAAYHLEADWREERTFQTPFGEAGPVAFFDCGGETCAFLSRHGGKGQLGLTPPFINYWANLWVAHEIGARRILSWNSGGGMHRSLSPGTIAVIADLIDWTRRRPTSFRGALRGEGAAGEVMRLAGVQPGKAAAEAVLQALRTAAEASAAGPADARPANVRPANAGPANVRPADARPANAGPTVPRPLFDPAIRIGLAAAAQSLGHRVAPGAIYAATEGARLETRAEIALLARAGAEVVGMTMSPEVFLAQELGIPYGSVCWISNYATGIPFDGPEQRLFGPEVGPLMFGIIRRFIESAESAASSEEAPA
jgi:purine nucleoside phosphorylase